MIQAMSRNAIRLQKLTDDILDVTRIESETLMLKIEPLDLDDLISNIVEDYRNQIEKNMIILSYYTIATIANLKIILIQRLLLLKQTEQGQFRSFLIC